MDLSIVIVDDNPGSLELLEAALSREGVAIHIASRPSSALELVRQYRPQLVLTDLVMPEMTGLDLLNRIMEFAPATDVVLMTAHYTTETAVEAIRNGAADYLEKPIRLPVLRERVGRLLDDARRRESAVGDAAAEFEGLIGTGAKMAELFARIRRIAPHYRSALIHGATGTGKDLVARALHARSGVRGQYVVLNCSAVVETLFESELFGHVKGAFTGADRDKPGLFEAANEGTLFLDEIGDMPMGTQAKLLRALQNQEILRVGSLQPRKVNVRVIAATHRNLRQAVSERAFREDLYYRLAMVELEVPSLAERPEDLPLLTRHFIQKFAQQYGRKIRGVTPRARLVLERHTWPGNVRELLHAVEAAMVMCEGAEVLPEHLPASLRQAAAAAPATNGKPRTLDELERAHILAVLDSSGGHRGNAAKALGISERNLYRKLRDLSLLP